MKQQDGYYVLKLVSGEELLSNVYFEDNQLLLENPVTFTKIQESESVFIKIKPWLELVESENVFYVDKDKVITMSDDLHEDLVKIYNEYIENYVMTKFEFMENMLPINEDNNEMGYVCTVEEARAYLDTMWNS